MAETTFGIVPVFLTLIAFFASGLVWTLKGYVKDWRKNHNNPDWAGFDKRLFRNDVVLGLILGGGAIVYMVWQGNLEYVVTAKGFIDLIISSITTVVVVDSLLVKGFLESD